MAYSGKITVSNFKEAYTAFIRWICDDPNTPGRDWSLVWYELDTTSGNFSYISYSGSINVQQLNYWYYLPTVQVTEYSFTRNGNLLVEGTDYVIDWFIGKVKFLTGTPPYTVSYSYKFKRFKLVFYNVGPGETDNNWVGFLLNSPGLYKANVCSRVYKYFKPGYTPFYDTVYGSYRYADHDPAFGFWDSTIDLWIFSNRFRIIVVAKSNVYYSFLYVGRFVPFCLPQEYLYPLLNIGDLNIKPDCSVSQWYDSTSSYRSFIAMAYFSTYDYYSNSVCNPDGVFTQSITLVPTQNDKSLWGEIAYMTGFKKVLIPIYIVSSYTLGTFHGVYWSPGFGLASESTIQIDGDTYIIFQNVFRTTWSDFMAIKCE